MKRESKTLVERRLYVPWTVEQTPANHLGDPRISLQETKAERGTFGELYSFKC
jgi:hypothetical protein